jgi:hypothetical protein
MTSIIDLGSNNPTLHLGHTSTSLIRTGMIEPVQEQSLRRHVGGFFSVHIGEKIPLRLPKRRAQRYPWETEAEIERRYP